MVKVDEHVKQAIRDKYAWPGGYPLFLITSDGAALCIDCGKKEYRNAVTAMDKGVGMQRTHELIGSWIIVDKVTGKPICELYNPRNVARVNTDKYQVYTAHEWLAYFNKQIANNA